ncbi:MAG: DUF4397 domain-containing protein, partial [Gemmatimonadaceae bacterium]
MPIRPRHFVAVAFSVLATACSSRDNGTAPIAPNDAFQFVNGFGAPVDLLVDGVEKASALANGTVSAVALDAGSRAVVVRTNGTSASLSVIVSSGKTVTVAALRGVAGALAAQTLDDSNAVVPANATKLRVLHLAPLAGEVQVWRTQPDYQTPIRWAFPFLYNTAKTYYQSTPGSWEVRVWTDTNTYPPGDARGWGAALDAAIVTL